ncbi:hypothetical protein ZWY2020_058865 [Hordeum vulgare]|nr:hypothetical protein ZWY2020_058865 [Hordeum vulgare]
MAFLKVEFQGADTPLGSRPHAATSTDRAPTKDRLQLLYVKKGVLPRHLDIMHWIFCNTLFPRIGNFDEVHGSLAEMLLLCEEAMTKESAPLDISDIMFLSSELHHDRKAHVAQKESRQRHKRVLRTLDVDISSGSEDDITPKATWMQAQGYQWSGAEEEEEEQDDPEGTDESGDAEDEE